MGKNDLYSDDLNENQVFLSREERGDKYVLLLPTIDGGPSPIVCVVENEMRLFCIIFI